MLVLNLFMFKKLKKTNNFIMMVLIIILYLTFISLFLLKKKKTKPCLKKLKKVKLICGNFSFFCFKSRAFELFNLLNSSTINFKSEWAFKKYVTPLNNVGIDYKKNIIKIEVYKHFNWEDIKKELETLKNLRNNISFYTLIFVDNIKNISLIQNFLNKINFNLDTKIYYCLDVNYKLLSSINFFNVNYLNYNSKSSINKQKFKNKQCNNLSSNNTNGFSLSNKFFTTFTFDGNFLVSNLNNNNLTCKLKKSVNYDLNLEIYNLKILNSSNKKTINFCYTKNFNNLKEKNVNVLICNKSGIYFENKNSLEKIIFSKFFNPPIFENNKIILTKKITLQKNEEKNFYFVKFLKNQIPLKISLETLFLNTINMYKNLNKIKVLSTNKVLNNLINFALPKKMIEKFLNAPEQNYNKFANFLNFKYDENLVEKSLICVPFYNFNLINNNIYKVYFNLVFYYFGIWKTKNNGAILNQDKSLILENSKIFFNIDNNKKFLIKNKKENLNNEVKINNIVYSNLKFLNFKNFLDNGKEEVEICY